MSDRRRRPLTARGLGALVLGVLFTIAANIVSAPILVYVAVLLFILTAFAVLAVYVPRRSGTVTRQVSTDLLTVGEESRVTVRFALRSLRIPHGLWRDVLPDAVTGSASGEYPPDSGVLRYPITGVRRGVWPVGPLILRTVDPFGLAQREQAFGDTRTVTVVPEVIPLAPLAAHWGAAGGTAHTASSRLGQGSDNLSPRHYVSGDSMRRIHWRASAHRGELMVRQEERESNPEAVVVFDRSLARWTSDALRSPGEDPGFEVAVSTVLSAAARFVREGYSVAVIDVDGTELVEGIEGGDTAAIEAMATGFATLTARRDGALTELAALFAGSTLGPVVVVTGEVSPADAASLAPIVSHSSMPVLFTLTGAGDALRVAREGGWRVHRLEPEDEIERLWSGVTGAEGIRSHAG